MSASIHPHTVTLNTGETLSLSQHSGKVLLLVNTASKCGFTPQYEGLEKLHEQYADKGLVVMGFPCDQFGHQEPGNNEEIAKFCSLNYDVKFALSEKIDVNGEAASPLFKTLKEQAPGILGSKRIKWNFTKFLVGKNGEVIKRYAPTTKPSELISDIESALQA
ncbi:glutathione peroxidase [Glaciecola siphonariae]|uniref:Glutathione peroxidase n=1 Tax=Glaciecola siphonariae TaxID=521012 RepID=A0ABV9LU38_9ALTE